MSGQPYRYAKDVENFRNEYMDALNLRASLDDMNLQANKVYKETGALPPKSTMKDMRTTAEILADVEKLKNIIIKDFEGLATPQMIQLVLQRVQNSPLNGDGSFMIWLSQNTPELVTQLKKKYRFGIAGDSNDAENMYLFIQNLFSQTKDMNTTLKSAFDRPIGSDNIGVRVGEIAKLKTAYDDIATRLLSSPNISALRTTIGQQFTTMNQFLMPQAPPLPSKYDRLKDIFLYISTNATVGQQGAINQAGYDALIEYTDKLPSAQQLRTLLDQLTRSEQNQNPDLTVKILENISSILPPVNTSRYMDSLADDIIANVGATLGNPPPNVPLAPPAPQALAQQRAIGAQASLAFMFDISAIINGVVGPIAQPAGLGNGPHQEVRNEIDNNLRISVGNLDIQYPNWQLISNYDQNVLDQAVRQLTDNYNWYYLAGAPAGAGAAGLPAAGIAPRNITQAMVQNAINAARPNPNVFAGAGLHRVGRPKGSGIVKPLSQRIDNTKGIKQGHSHVPFGKYIINKNRLDDDIFSFKHVKGYGVKGYPSKKISRNLSSVIKTIIGGGVPKYNELSNLSEEEKNYLHTVSSKAGIMDKISVPTPSKDSQEQDVHQFEVMKGEILAGNDSSVLIKKFKLLLLKLSKNGSLPKRECQEIMEDLIQLGY